MPKKLEVTTLEDFSTPILSLNIPFVEKKGPFGIFFIHSVGKRQTIEGTLWGNFLSEEKVPQCRKKTQKWDPLVSPSIVGGKRKNLLDSVRKAK